MNANHNYTIYGMTESGNCYKVKLLMEQLNIPYQWHEVDIFNNETKSESYLQMNPVGEVPVLAWGDGSLAQSNAILYYLAKDSDYFFNEPLLGAQILQWMFFEQYTHEPYIAVARKIVKLLPNDHPDRVKLPQLEKAGYHALNIMEQHLANNDFFVNGQYSIADISLFAYTHVAEEGGFDLQEYPNILRWIDKVKSQAGYVDMYSS